MKAAMMEFSTGKGTACPLGVMKRGKNKIEIAIWRQNAKDCKLCLYESGKTVKKLKMYSCEKDGMPDIFSLCLEGENLIAKLEGVEYDFVSDGTYFIDSYAQIIAGKEKFGGKRNRGRARFSFQKFDWSGEKWKKLKKNDMVFYQCHVRGFTKHASSRVKHPGTFSGLQEKIPYLKKLGVNALLLLPVYEFDECRKEKINYWGYTDEAHYFAPKASYASEHANPITEYKNLIKAIHQQGMNLFMDMYFENQTPEFILRCLRYYAIEFHIDGFRINQNCMDTGWLQHDPILSHVILIGTGWADSPKDIGQEHLYEMNDGFMLDARRFLKSDEGQVEHFFHRFNEQRSGVGLIHYITQNNGFTLRDLVSYDVKHNEANGEKNTDGTEYNYSWNCGVEGPTRRKPILQIRKRQEKNALVMLVLGMGIPMILAGDEFGNSQKGNNNAYCQDNLTTWLDWKLLEKNKDTFEFMRYLLKLRSKYKLYHQDKNLNGMDVKGVGVPDVSSHGVEPWGADFSYYSRELGILYYGSYFDSNSLYFAFNFHWDPHVFFLPDIDVANEWNVVLDTANEHPEKIEKGTYKMEPRSIAIFEKICNRSDKADRTRN